MTQYKLMGATAIAAVLASSLSAEPVKADIYKYNFGPNAWISLGAGVRAAYRDSSNDDITPPDDFQLENARVYVNGQASKVVGFTVNGDIERDAEGDVIDYRVLDALVRLEFNQYFNVYAGRMLPPSDRANLDGPFYLGIWDYPLVSAFPADFQGREDGGSIWGAAMDGRFHYAVGVFQGCADDQPCSTDNGSNDPLVTTRLGYDFWDKETGYYANSDYYGEKEILSVGFSAYSQSDATGTRFDRGDYFGYSFDALMQKKVFGSHVFTLEGAYYNYDTDGKPSPLIDGDGYFALASFLIDYKIGYGKLAGRVQPVIRYEELFRDDGAPDTNRLQTGINYIMNGHKARASFLYSHREVEGVGGARALEADEFIAGLQLQF